jgi:hypothetical protein
LRGEGPSLFNNAQCGFERYARSDEVAGAGKLSNITGPVVLVGAAAAAIPLGGVVLGIAVGFGPAVASPTTLAGSAAHFTSSSEGAMVLQTYEAKGRSNVCNTYFNSMQPGGKWSSSCKAYKSLMITILPFSPKRASLGANEGSYGHDSLALRVTHCCIHFMWPSVHTMHCCTFTPPALNTHDIIDHTTSAELIAMPY